MLTAAQIEQFHRDGFVVIRQMFKGRELELLREAADRVVAEGVARKGENHLYWKHKDGSEIYRRSEFMWKRDPSFRAATVKPELLECMAQCFGHPFMPVNDSFVVKVPRGNVPVLWHQDPPYMDENDKRGIETLDVPNFDTDIYLDNSTVDNGCVWGIPGHHLVGHVDLSRYTQEQLFNDCGAVPLEMKAGDVLFHCLSAPHGSVGNQTDKIRKIFYIHYMPREVAEKSYAGFNWLKGDVFNEKGLQRNEQFIADRQTLGFADVHSPHLKNTTEGFEFHPPAGTPATPPHHWRKLIDAITPQEKARMRTLETVFRGTGAAVK